MAERPEARIVTQPAMGGQTEIFVYEPATGKTHRTGLAVPRDQVEPMIRKLKQQLERAGNHVSVKEME